MDCPNCGRANRHRANFCRYCGAHFALACPMCRAVLPDDSVFCDNCGHAVKGGVVERGHGGVDVERLPQAPAAPPSPAGPHPLTPTRTPAANIPAELAKKLESVRATGEMIGERRIVTMLFCDVKGSTEVAERLDPEDYSEIMNGAFAHMIEPIYRYEGTLARLMGDALLAFFGAPISHEDDPQRAVMAGLDIVAAMAPYREQVRQAWGLDFNVRVGINTGLVVVGAVGSDLKVEYSALGDAINLAARMEQTAQPGSVQIAHDTYKLVSDQFELEALGEIEVKGKREPVPAYRVLARKAAGSRRRGIEGLRAAMVGREEELGALREVLGGLKLGVGRIVCVLGEAGLGKSRLVEEARQDFEAVLGSQGAWLETGSLSYETKQAYGMFQRLLRRAAGIGHDDPPGDARRRLRTLTEALPLDQRDDAQRIFEALLGMGDAAGLPALEGEAFRQALLEAVQGWWRSQAGQRPTVLVFDDMHWSDAASIELLLELLALTGEVPLVLLCVLRAEREAPAWQVKTTADAEHQHRYLELTLRPLSEADSRELVTRLLAVAELPETLLANILEKSAGNPFFIEEVVRTLIDSGVVVPEDRPATGGGTQRYWRASNGGADFAIPGSLQSLLASRMDRLEDGTRGTLQVASVIGRSFHRRVLQAVDEASSELDKRIGTLLRTEMIRETARLPEVEYAFRNPLTQEAVYETILIKRRRQFHQRVGEAMEALYSDRLDGLFGLLAHHFALAGEHAKAIGYLRRAAQQALGLYAYDDAISGLRTALELAGHGQPDETRLLVLEELGDVYLLLRDGSAAIAHYQQALQVCEAMSGAAEGGGLAEANGHTGQPEAGQAGGLRLAAVRLHRKIVQMVSEVKWSVSAEQMAQARQARLPSRARLEAALTGGPGGPDGRAGRPAGRRDGPAGCPASRDGAGTGGAVDGCLAHTGAARLGGGPALCAASGGPGRAAARQPD